jgi:hypothetical protein
MARTDKGWQEQQKQQQRQRQQAQSSSGGGATATSADVIADIQQVMTLLVELQHEPHGGGRQAAAHSRRLAELVNVLHKELQALNANERKEYDKDLNTILNLSVDGKGGKKLGAYLKENQATQWGKDYATNWENSQRRQAMQQEMHTVMHSLQGSLIRCKACEQGE